VRILAVHEAYVRGGAEHSLADLIAHWPVDSDHWVVLTNSSHPNPSVFREVGAELATLGALPEHEVAAGSKRAISEVESQMRFHSPHCLVLNNGGFPGGNWNFVAMQSAANASRPSIMIVRNVSPTRSLASARENCSRYLNVLVAVTDHLVEAMDARQVAPCKVVRIYNGVPFPTGVGDTRTRLRGILRCAIVGRIEERKGHVNALQAVSQLVQRGVNISLTFMGDADTSYLDCLAGGPDWRIVRPLRWPHTEDLEQLFHDVDVLLVPSIRQESCSRVVLEAAARGIPSIVSTCGGLPELVDSASGWVVPIGDVSGLVDAIAQAARNPLALSQRGDAARARHLRNYTVSEMANSYAKILYGLPGIIGTL
jgi:hypothetical protein